jgi:hypothetical protein
MAIKNIRLNIHTPGVEGLQAPIVFTSVATDGDSFRIPYRYPFVDVAHYNLLKDAGVFRHSTKTVSTNLGSNTTDTEGGLGLQLPRTEKLILLVKRSANEDSDLTISGNTRTGKKDVTIKLLAGGTATYFSVESSATAGEVKLTSMSGATATIAEGDKFIYNGVTYTALEDATATSSVIASLEVYPAFPSGVSTPVAIPAIDVFPNHQALNEIDLYDLGFFVGGYEDEKGVIITTEENSVQLALIARF